VSPPVPAGLEVHQFGAARPAPSGGELVFLHDGLGCARSWRTFPAQIAAAVGGRATVYSRRGYGGSPPLPDDAPTFEPDFLRREAFDSLPELVRALGLADPILIGHSDGASIALEYAAAGYPARALVLLAPHTFVEETTVRSIAALQDDLERRGLRARLERWHGAKAGRTFAAWSGVWLSPEFRSWDIRPELSVIRCPVLALQGTADEFGTPEQVAAITRGIPGAEGVLLRGAGHAPHRDQPKVVIAKIAEFVRKLERRERAGRVSATAEV
jgi:pimeloyl-ACP methyl ester carboxylesterase